MPGKRRKERSTTPYIILFLLIAIILVLYVGRQGSSPAGRVIAPTDTVSPVAPPVSSLKIASWNLQRFGPDKAANASLLAYYADVLRNYDIIILQEITDSTGSAFPKLCSLMDGYACTLSDKMGPSSYKEQYGLIYKNALLISSSRGSGTYVRPPYTYLLSAGNWSFYLTTLHTDPGNVKSELAALDAQIGGDHVSDRVIMGDLNADCSYYRTPPTDFSGWKWVVPDWEDTTVKDSDCAYDRIIINIPAENNYVSYGVMRNVSAAQSDHFLIYGVFRTDEA